jgi:hypothetical protein
MKEQRIDETSVVLSRLSSFRRSRSGERACKTFAKGEAAIKVAPPVVRPHLALNGRGAAAGSSALH